MRNRILIFIVALGCGCAGGQVAPRADWNFAVSGDSRNCGDVVVPAIAEGARREHAAFYWHLGDLRHMADDYAGTKVHPDEDYLHEPEHRGRPADKEQYVREAWDDFIQSQIKPFGNIPVFVGIGNHELVNPRTRQEFIAKFSHWLDAPYIKKLRLHDNPEDTQPHTYFHWIQGGVDFVYLDNAT